jgi:hypothetical protein
MAERPVFVPARDHNKLVEEFFFPLRWNSGFALVQKEKNIKALRESAKAAGLSPLLEISTKSDNKRGRHLSAFHMSVPTKGHGRIKLELAFQGSKVFERGGPFTDLYLVDEKEIGKAKRDPRLKESGNLIGFEFEGIQFPLEPKTVFYDWLYISFLNDYRDWAPKLYEYAGFTDVEFNPQRSINCQARSAALFVSLMRQDLLDEATESPQSFIQMLSRFDYHPHLRTEQQERPPLFGAISDSATAH